MLAGFPVAGDQLDITLGQRPIRDHLEQLPNPVIDKGEPIVLPAWDPMGSLAREEALE